jgi:hypothetical protein
MSTSSRVVLYSALICGALLLTGSVFAGDGDKCCFTNPRFTGVCVVTPGPEETCATILAYLNDQTSTGRTYCGNTTVRGGWAQVSCEQSTAVAPRCTAPPRIDTFIQPVEVPRTTSASESSGLDEEPKHR